MKSGALCWWWYVCTTNEPQLRARGIVYLCLFFVVRCERFVSRPLVGLSGVYDEDCENFDDCGEGYTARVGPCDNNGDARDLPPTWLGLCGFETCCQGASRTKTSLRMYVVYTSFFFPALVGFSVFHPRSRRTYIGRIQF